MTKKLYYYPEVGFTSNSYIIDDGVRVLIDPGHHNRLDGLIKLMKEDGFSMSDVDWIIVTHAHVDHCGAVHDIQKKHNIKVAMHEEEKQYLELAVYFHRLFGERMTPFTVDHWFKGERCSDIGGLKLVILHTPGHTPGSISIYSPEGKYLICGDLVFEGGVGRTDLGGSSEMLRKSIELVSQLDIDMLLPGHGPLIVGREEVIRNFRFVMKFMDYFL